LEAQRREQESKAKEASQLLQQTEKFYTEVSTRANSLQERERELKRYQEQEIQKALLSAKAEINEVIRRLQAGTKTGRDAQKATEELTAIAERLLPKTEKTKVNYRPQVGERVRLPNLGQTAEVLAISPESDEISLRFGMMKMTLPLDQIESLDGQKVETAPKPAKNLPQTPTKPQETPLIRTANNTVDIRGSRVAESETDIEQAIIRATPSGILWIIHGKGTGKLRQGVHDFLSRHPQVKRFQLAPQNEGGSGVTIAYLT
jgi:DNA mismatch repair protein MutS2